MSPVGIILLTVAIMVLSILYLDDDDWGFSI